MYMVQHSLTDAPARFDVVLVTAHDGLFGMKRDRIEVIENAFGL